MTTGAKNKSTAYIGLGSNLGDRIGAIEAALGKLSALPGVSIDRVASFYESQAAGGPPDQPNYLNTVARLYTTLPPRELLRHMLAVEHALGRKRSQRWGPRIIDLDLLCYDVQTFPAPQSEDTGPKNVALELPHPRMHERLFVLKPLAELAPDWIHPVFGDDVKSLIARCEG